jgi:hypothetical protein
MSQRNALVLISGRFYELPVGDTLIGTVGTGQSGQFASVTALNASGANLLSQIAASAAGVSTLNSLSGALTLAGGGNVTVSYQGQTIFVSGDTGDYAAFALRIDLSSTGAAINDQIGSLSGWAESADSLQTSNSVNLSGNLTQTGVSLYQRDIDISGSLAAQIAGGNGTAVKVTGSATLTAASLTGIGGTIVYLDGGIVYVSGGGGGNGDVTSVQLASTGQQAWTSANNNGVNLSGNLASTGAVLGARTDSLSGWTASAANLTTTGSMLDARINTVSTNLQGTGLSLYSLVTNLSGQSDTNYATKTVLAATGSNLYALTTSLSGQADTNYATKTSLASSGQQAWLAAQNNALNISGNLAQTGVILGTRIDTVIANVQSTGSSLYSTLTSLSGQADTNYATRINVTTTGVNLGTRIDTITTNLTSSGASLGAKVDSLSGWSASTVNLGTTGATLFQRDIDISGALASQIAGGNGTVVKVTGSSTLATANFTGIGGTIVYIDAGIVYVSGGGGGGAGDVTSAQLANTGQQAWVAADNNGINLSGNMAVTGATLGARVNTTNTNLQSTGSSLYSFITAASGQADTNYATKTALANTGQQAWTTANSSATTISGNLAQTGADLFARDASISGALNTKLGTQAAGQIIYNAGNLAGDTALTWDSVNEVFNIGQATAFTTNPLTVAASGDISAQITLQNLSSGSGASSDFVATADNGTDTINYVNIGINSSNYNQTGYSIGGALAGYLYCNGGDLTIGTQTPGKVIKFHTSGTTAGQLRATIDNSGINLPAGHSLRINGQVPQFTKGGVFYNSDGLASGIQRTIVWTAPFSCTATNVRGFVVNVSGNASPTSATINAVKNAANLLSSDFIVTGSGIWMNSGTLQNSSFVVGDSLWLNISNAVNGPASVAIQVDFTKP